MSSNSESHRSIPATNPAESDRGRRRFLAQVGAGLSTLGAPAFLKHAHAAEFTIKFANNAPLTYPTNVRVREAAAKIRKETAERVNIQIFPASQLGADPEMFSQVRSGAIQIYYTPGLMAQNASADCGIHTVAFAFQDMPSVWKAIDGDLGALVRQRMGTLGIHALDTAWDNGFRQITTTDRQINSPADLKGLKIRTPAFPMITSIFETLGAAPTTISIKETYAALQTRLADGQENPKILLEVLKFYEVQKYCALTNHVWDGFWTGINKKYWDSLPKDIQTVIEKHLREAALLQRTDIAALERRLQTDMEAKGIVFNRPDQLAFKEVLRSKGYYTKWRQSFSDEAWATLEKYTGKLA